PTPQPTARPGTHHPEPVAALVATRAAGRPCAAAALLDHLPNLQYPRPISQGTLVGGVRRGGARDALPPARTGPGGARVGTKRCNCPQRTDVGFPRQREDDARPPAADHPAAADPRREPGDDPHLLR